MAVISFSIFEGLMKITTSSDKKIHLGQTLRSLDEKTFDSKDIEIEWVLSIPIGRVKAIWLLSISCVILMSYSKLKKSNFNFLCSDE